MNKEAREHVVLMRLMILHFPSNTNLVPRVKGNEDAGYEGVQIPATKPN